MKNLDLYIRKLMPVKKSVAVGVDIGHDCIRMVKATGAVMLGHKCVPIPQSIEMGSPEFEDILRSELSPFCGPLKETEIWAAMPPSILEIRHIRIPKVGKKQIANAVYWTTKKEAPFDERETILDFVVQGDVMEQDNQKLSVMVCTAPAREVEEIKALFSRMGLPLKGISVAPFAVQNIFRRNLPGMEGTSAVLSIGDDSSRLDIYTQGNLVLTRNINTEINSMAEPSLPALQRLTRQIEMTFEHYAINLGNEKIDRLYVSGDIKVQGTVLEYMRDRMRIPTQAFDPMNSLSFTEENFSKRLSLVPSLGLALSGSDTPNLLHIHKDKEKEASITRINNFIFAVFMVSVLICAGIFIYQGRIEARKKNLLVGLEQELSRFNPRLDQNLILQAAAKIKDRDGNLKEYGKRYIGMAVIEELSGLTPHEIRLVNLAVKSDGLTVEGIAVGDRYSAEASLLGFMMKLDGSPIFSQVGIQKGEFETSKGLHFTINLKVGQP